MSVYVMAWVFKHSPTKLGDRLVLLALADYAHDDGGSAFPSVDSLATKARVGKSTARAALRRLEADGHIASEGVTPKGCAIYRVVMGAPDSGGCQDQAEGRQDSAPGGPGSGPNPSGGTVKEPSTRERARTTAESLPEDFPDAMRPHARGVYRTLREVAVQHNAREVTPRAVGLAIMGAPGRRHVQEALSLASWAQAPPRPIRDVVGTYRTWLQRAETFAGVERVDEDGYPAAAPTSTAGNVTPLHGGRRRTQTEETLAQLDAAIADGRLT